MRYRQREQHIDTLIDNEKEREREREKDEVGDESKGDRIHFRQ